MKPLEDEEIWRVAKVWYQRNPKANGDKTKGWFGLNEARKRGYYMNAKAVLISLRHPKPSAHD